MPLTDRQARAAQAAEKPYRLTDEKGLHLYVTPGGSKLWRMRYEFHSKEKLLSFGPYPEVSLAQAREDRDGARTQLRLGRDPSLEKKLRRATAAGLDGQLFEQAARAWHALQAARWTMVHAADVIGSLEAHVFPAIGALPLSEITPPMVLALLRLIERRPAIETARRVRQRISAVFVHGIGAGLCADDPAAKVLGAMAPIPKGRPRLAVVNLAELRTVLEAAEAQPAHPVTKLALRFLALTVVRPGEVRHAHWAEFEGLGGAEPIWSIPAERMKMRRQHQVPLSRQAVEVLEALRPLTGHGLPFPNARHPRKPMSENAMGYLLNRAGFHSRHVPHGWRASFSTIMNERDPADRAVIDLMLAHENDNAIEGAYNRARHLPRRRELAQAWADLLLEPPRPAFGLLAGPRRGSG